MSTEPMTQAIAVLRTRVGASYGQAGRDWCNELPVLIADLVSRWGLTLTGEPARAGYGGIAVPVIRVDHGQAILKVTFSLDVRDLENEVLYAWGGRHAAQLLERDDRRHARLLERLGPLSLSDSGDPVTAMSIAGQLAAHLAVRPPPDLRRMADVAPDCPHDQRHHTRGLPLAHHPRCPSGCGHLS